MAAAALGRRRWVPPDLARSWLLVPATAIEGCQSADADQVILDLEDGVDPGKKEAARQAVATFLADGGAAWVRINPRSTSHWRRDLESLRDATGVKGIVLAKTESPDEVSETSDMLEGVRVIPLIESAVGIESSIAIATTRGSFRLAFGSGDYRRDTGTGSSDMALVYPRSRLVTASRIGNLSGPIDGPATSRSRLESETRSAQDLGMTGKLCVRPLDALTINSALSPTPVEVAWADDVLAEFDESGGVVRDGSDPPRLGRAAKIQRLASAYQVIPGSDSP
ncbi:CoA ester lyase [Amnibacterium sp.]|uniref:HpcH/HpaI aldolase/citrate lyase family protein n=1 Tax=Amnibacterium sp. TaxID=1872496 RepID=UPI0026250EC2|nr:CoA ester lyase [Amnibacterium sp.]MCU1472811.1 aldolase [Amnibacterium sp.]